MELYPAVIVHGLADAVAALAQSEAAQAEAAQSGVARAGVAKPEAAQSHAAGPRPVTLLSAPGAALYAGCGWWRALVEAARASHPHVPCIDILDCADATGHALAALRIGLTRLVLWPGAPGRDAVVAIAESLGGFVLPAAPPVNPPVNPARLKRAAASTSDGRLAQPGRAQSNHAAGNGDKPGPPG